MKGTLVAGGAKFPVIDIQLVGGRVKIVAHAVGPLEPGEGYPTVFGEDGQGVLQGPSLFQWPGASAGDVIEIIYWLRPVYVT